MNNIIIICRKTIFLDLIDVKGKQLLLLSEGHADCKIVLLEGVQKTPSPDHLPKNKLPDLHLKLYVW